MTKQDVAELLTMNYACNDVSFRKGCGNCIASIMPYCYVGVSGGEWEDG